MVETINRLVRVQRQLLQELALIALPEEIAEEMGISVERVGEIMKIAQEPVSLETQSVKKKIVIWVILLKTKSLRPSMQLLSRSSGEQLRSVGDAYAAREEGVTASVRT